jgi:hypothetical protein
MRFNAICLLAIGLLLGCSDDSVETKQDAAAKDTQVAVDTTQGGETSPTKDSAVDTAQAKDLAPGEGVAEECTPATDNCTGGLKCLCCGSIGPSPICVCSTPCSSTADCTHANLPSCNKATDAGTGGICTPVGYNCCWFCK